MDAFKGFDKNLRCRGYQYEIGGEYEEEEAILCKKGFHACEYPLDCFKYYPPAMSRFCEVEIDDNGERNNRDSKLCGHKIKIQSELETVDIYYAAFMYAQKNHGCIRHYTPALVLKTSQAGTLDDNLALVAEDRCAVKAGEGCALVGGKKVALRTENNSAVATGDCSVLIAEDLSALTAGERSELTSGHCSALVADNKSILKAGDGSALVGRFDTVVSSGDDSALIAGPRSELSAGANSVVYGGYGAKVRAGIGSVLALKYFNNGVNKGLRVKIVDGEKIKANVWYRLDKAGRFIKAKN